MGTETDDLFIYHILIIIIVLLVGVFTIFVNNLNVYKYIISIIIVTGMHGGDNYAIPIVSPLTVTKTRSEPEKSSLIIPIMSLFKGYYKTACQCL